VTQKRLTYLLFPVVAAIWGYAIYKYLFENQSDESLPSTTITSIPTIQDTTQETPETFTLLTNYRDPFNTPVMSTAAPNPRIRGEVEIKSGSFPRSETPHANHPTPKPAPQAPPTTDWTQYTFNGLIQHSGTAARTGILRINGKAYNVTPGTKAQNAEVLSMTPDSITLKVAEETYTIIRR
jgi:hypothetical protein